MAARRSPLATLLTLLGVAAAAYLLLALALFLMQGRLLFLAGLGGRVPTVTPALRGLDYEDVELVTEDGERLHGWFVPAGPGNPTVLFFHGNAGNIGHRLETLALLHELGVNVLLFDYRGYGRSSGSPSEQGTYRDATAAWRWLTVERGIAPGDVVLFGRSLGGAIASELATRVAPRALIVESAFTSVPDVAAELYPWLPVRWLARHRYPTVRHVAAIACPLLVIHSEDDEVIGIRHGERVYAAAGEPKSMLRLRGGHNDAFLLSADRYRAGLQRFLDL